MGKSVRKDSSSSSLDGIVLKCPSSPQLTSPHSLKEQLELIHQIIQQTTEESAVVFSSSSHPGSTTNHVLTTKQALTTPPVIIGVNSNAKSSPLVVVNKNKQNPSQVTLGRLCNVSSGDKEEEKVGNGGSSIAGEEVANLNSTGKGEDKPVQCAICCRRFKNTPALNGHMRLHGGYFKKETDGKKKEPATKETQGTPLQTASVSVLKLIEEKIIQRRNAGSGSSSASSTPKTSPPTSSPTTPTKKPLVSTLSPSLIVSATATQFLQTEVVNSLKSSNNSTTATTTFTNNHQHCQPLPFEDAHAEYLLIEEEVFNKVSSICGDSFFSGIDGIDESMLCESGIGSDSSQISVDFFNWSSAVTNSNNSSCGNTLFTTGPTTPTANSTSSNDNPFTPLPSMDPVFFTPTPGSVHSHHSQSDLDGLADSPSFIYPTPPASLESHNALQSPLFPFPFPFDTSPQSTVHTNLMTNSNQPLVMVSPTSTSSNGMRSINCNNSGINNLLGTSISALGMSKSNSAQTSGLLLATSQQAIEMGGSISGPLPSVQFAPGLATSGTTDQSSIITNQSQYDINPGLLVPSSSPSIAIPSLTTATYSLGGVLGTQPLSKMKGNEPCSIMGDSTEESFRSPHRIFTMNVNSNALVSKVPKRKALRTLASNLRPQMSQSPSHFTPYPILSPVRSAPGLFWTFSAKLTHVDENRKDRPRINLGANFQAAIPPLEQKGTIKNDYMLKKPEDLLWTPDSVSNCFHEDVEKYLEFASCSAVPGGGQNKEYALHILNLCGDINVAMLLLMNPSPKLPVHLFQYKYPEREKWCRTEILQFEESLLRHGKDFFEVSKELGSKSGEACVSFYQLWKKVCPSEYERIRTMWKKREAAFTIELLKTIPAPTQVQAVTTPGSGGKSSAKQNKSHLSQQPSPASSRGLSLNDEFPCKICGKIFSKVKSRSAHMKSHRPPPTPPSNSPAPVLSPASAATLLENKEKIADALQKHIFGKACASLAKSIQAAASPPTPAPVAPFMPKIVKVESISPSNMSMNIPASQPQPTQTVSCFQSSTPTPNCSSTPNTSDLILDTGSR